MSGLDYTKKSGLSNISRLIRQVRVGVYELIFLSRTRYEKWLLYTSLCFGFVGICLSIYLFHRISTPAPIVISCDMERVREVLSLSSSSGSTSIKTEEIVGDTPNPPKKPIKALKKTKKSISKKLKSRPLGDPGG